MRRDQLPLSSCVRGSGFPMPEFGSRCTSRIRRIMRRAIARSCSTHHARSSKAAASNSKFLNGFLERETFLTLLRFEKSALHRVRLEEVRRLPLGFYLAPKSDGHDNGGRLAVLARDELDFSVR